MAPHAHTGYVGTVMMYSFGTQAVHHNYILCGTRAHATTNTCFNVFPQSSIELSKIITTIHLMGRNKIPLNHTIFLHTWSCMHAHARTYLVLAHGCTTKYIL